MENRGAVLTIAIVLAVAVILGNFGEMSGNAVQKLGNLQLRISSDEQTGTQNSAGGSSVCPDITGENKEVSGKGYAPLEHVARDIATHECGFELFKIKYSDEECKKKCNQGVLSLGYLCDGASGGLDITNPCEVLQAECTRNGWIYSCKELGEAAPRCDCWLRRRQPGPYS